MLAPSPIPPPSTMEEPLDFDNGAFASTGSGQRQFKRHKVLPRPPSVRSHDTDSSPPHRPSSSSLNIDSSLEPTQFQPPSPPALKRQSKRIPTGPELPPTPPTHSRTTSSSSHSAVPSSPTLSDPMLQHSPDPAVPALSPATPPDQRSPPTPDVTPPQPATRPKALRPSPARRGASGTTTTESRTESFTTAREELPSSSEDESRSTIRPGLASGRTSQSTVRKSSGLTNGEIPSPHAVSQALLQLPSSQPQKRASPQEVDKPAMEDKPAGNSERQSAPVTDRSATVKLKNVAAPRSRPRSYRREIVEDVDNTILPSSATQAVRHVSLLDKAPPKASSASHRDVRRHSSNPVRLDTNVAHVRKASSGSSPRSASSSAVVEAFLIEGPPRRHRTLRHVRKQRALREMTSQPMDLSRLSIDSNIALRHQESVTRNTERERHESLASSSTVNSIASRKARRDVWKSGGIPVVVVPDRRSSTRSSSREPSLRSTSSRRSRRTQSLSSAPLEPSDRAPPVDRRSRHSKSRSVSDGSERTIDFPPTIPARSSSLSAPTSRNASRTQSLTAESIRAHDAIQQKLEHDQLLRRLSPIHLSSDERSIEPKHIEQKPPTDKNVNTVTLCLPDSEQTQPRISIVNSPPTQAMEEDNSRLSVQAAYLASPKSDRFDESSMSTKRYTARNTPFSVASCETNGTTAEVSEALAIHMFPHQNSSVVMVNHSAKPSEASVSTIQKDSSSQAGGEIEAVKSVAKNTTDLPVTPPQPQFTLGEIDSPLRNPRSPPEPPGRPPALAFIPATPSGVTPAPDKDIQMGNFYESIAEKPPPVRRPSIVKRAFSRRRRHSTAEYPPNASRTSEFLKRALSIPKRRGSRDDDDRITEPYRGNYPWEDGVPPEEHKLHPFWRPQWPTGTFFDDDEDDYDFEEEDNWRGRDRDEGYMRYPPVDNRPPKPKRSLSARVKRTFAVLPSRRGGEDLIEDGEGPERRTIQRTMSGNLRVMKRRSSTGSLRQYLSQTEPSSSAPNFEPRRSFWQGSSTLTRTRSLSRRRFSLEEPIEKVQGLSRRFSERRREKRSQELRQRISGPKDVRDGVEDMIRSSKQREYV